MSIDPTLRGRCTQDDILLSIRDRLIDQLEWCTDQTCFLSDQPTPETSPSGAPFCTVSMGDGQFPHEFFTGGGADTCTEVASVIVTAINRVKLDRPRRVDRRLLEPDRGLVLLKRDILRALLGDPVWEPASGTQPLLRDLLAPSRSVGPGEVTIGDAKFLAVQLHFHTPFDWDLS